MEDRKAVNNANKITMHIVIPLELKDKLERMSINQDRVKSKIIERLIRMADENTQ